MVKYARYLLDASSMQEGLSTSRSYLWLQKCFWPIHFYLAADFYSTNPGPVADCVLYDQENHISAAILEGQEGGALRCHEHTSKLDRWMLTENILSLWRRETNTYHFTVGEMAVTLEDVVYLIGLPINGEPVIGVTYTKCHAVGVMVEW